MTQVRVHTIDNKIYVGSVTCPNCHKSVQIKPDDMDKIFVGKFIVIDCEGCRKQVVIKD